MSKEIKAKIDELRQQLEEATVPGMFTLNPEVVRINNEIESRKVYEDDKVTQTFDCISYFRFLNMQLPFYQTQI